MIVLHKLPLDEGAIDEETAQAVAVSADIIGLERFRREKTLSKSVRPDMLAGELANRFFWVATEAALTFDQIIFQDVIFAHQDLLVQSCCSGLNMPDSTMAM